MTYLQAVILGAVQGLTEFLPVSSSGHLVLIQSFMGLDNPDEMLAIDIALHFGTLLAVVLFFYRELGEILKDSYRFCLSGEWQPQKYPGARLFFFITIATLPAVFVGLFFKDAIEMLFVSPRMAGVGLLITGAVLMATRFLKKEEFELLSTKKSLWIGIAQAIAIVPGISRSGSTIAAGLFGRLSQLEAGRFAFLIAIPAILGASLLQLYETISLGQSVINFAPLIGPILAGTIASALTGFFAIGWLLRVIQKGKLHWFAWYCWGVGIFSLIFLR